MSPLGVFITITTAQLPIRKTSHTSRRTHTPVTQPQVSVPQWQWSQFPLGCYIDARRMRFTRMLASSVGTAPAALLPAAPSAFSAFSAFSASCSTWTLSASRSAATWLALGLRKKGRERPLVGVLIVSCLRVGDLFSCLWRCCRALASIAALFALFPSPASSLPATACASITIEAWRQIPPFIAVAMVA